MLPKLLFVVSNEQTFETDGRPSSVSWQRWQPKLGFSFNDRRGWRGWRLISKSWSMFTRIKLLICKNVLLLLQDRRRWPRDLRRQIFTAPVQSPFLIRFFRVFRRTRDHFNVLGITIFKIWRWRQRTHIVSSTWIPECKRIAMELGVILFLLNDLFKRS